MKWSNTCSNEAADLKHAFANMAFDSIDVVVRQVGKQWYWGVNDGPLNKGPFKTEEEAVADAKRKLSGSNYQFS